MDEAASALGLARAAAERGGELYADILRIQEELFVAGAELATAPEAAGRLEAGVSKVTTEMVERLEARHRPLHGPRRPAAQVRDPRRHRAVRPAGRGAHGRCAAPSGGSASLNDAGELADDTVLTYLNRASDAVYAMARFADEDYPELFQGRDARR